MGFSFKEFASVYGIRRTPTIVTDASLDVKFINHKAALLSVMQLGRDFIKRSLTPASMQKVQRCRRTGKATVFTQFFGKGYRQKFRVTVEWDEYSHLVFSFCRAHGARDSAPMTATLAECNMLEALDQIRAVVAPAKSGRGTAAALAKEVDDATMAAYRRVRQEWYKYQDPQCYAFHMPTLLSLILEPCNKYLEKKGSDYRILYHKISGDQMIKCDANLMCYVIYSLLSTAITTAESDVTLQYTELGDVVRLDIYGGEERPIVFSGFERETSRVNCDSLSLTSAYQLVEKMQGQLQSDWLSDTDPIFSLTMPIARTDGGFKEKTRTQLTELEETLEIEFSVL